MSIIEEIQRITTTVEVRQPGVQGPPGSGGGGGTVDSVNGQTGVVVLDATDVGADATGTAATALAIHVAAADPHPLYALESSLATVATTGAYADLTGKPTLGTAAPLNVAAAGDAASGEVVKGNDTRLTDARTPTNLTGPVTSVGNATAIANGAISNAMLANAAVANLSGTNTGDETGARVATLLHAASAKVTLVDADEVNGTDSAASFGLIRTTWTNVKAYLKTYFDTLYPSGSGSSTGTNTGDNAVNSNYSGLVSNATHTGDATGATALTLATVNSNVGSFTSANITVNAKGLVTAAANGSGGGSPGGSSGAVQGNTSSAFAGIPGFTYDTTSGVLTVATGTITTSQPAQTITQTWNAGAVTFKGAVTNIIDTASATGSNLYSWQLSGIDKTVISKRGAVVTNMTGTSADALFGWASSGNLSGNGLNAGNGFADLVCGSGYVLRATSARGAEIQLAACYGWADINNLNPDTRLYRGAAGRVDVCTTAAGTFGDLKARNCIATGYVQTAAVTVGTLPTASGVPYAIYSVTDSLAPVAGATVAAGGSAKATVQSNGTNWIVLGTL